jgi:hypothetical protein
MIIKCSLHNHTHNSDGYFPPEDLLIYLKHAGYDVVAITDHSYHTIPKRIPNDLIFIDGIEYWLGDRGMEIIGLSTPVDNPILANAVVAWVAHPKYLFCTFKQMVKTISELNNVDGCELYNDGELQLEPHELEYLSGYDINYYGVDDLHVPAQLMKSWIEMEVDSLDKDTVLKNLISGDFWLANRNT